MHQIYQQEENILSKLNSLLAMYRCLHFSQLCRIFPELSITQLTLLLKKLVRKDRIFLDSKKDLVYYAGITEANPAILSSFWVLLDFYPEVNYHTVSDYPVTGMNCRMPTGQRKFSPVRSAVSKSWRPVELLLLCTIKICAL